MALYNILFLRRMKEHEEVSVSFNAVGSCTDSW